MEPRKPGGVGGGRREHLGAGRQFFSSDLLAGSDMDRAYNYGLLDG